MEICSSSSGSSTLPPKLIRSGSAVVVNWQSLRSRQREEENGRERTTLVVDVEAEKKGKESNNDSKWVKERSSRSS